MAKSLNPEQLKKKLAIAGAKRIAEVLAEQLPDGLPDIPAGTYPMSLTYELQGDLIKGAAYRNEDKPGPKFSREDLLVAIFCGLNASDTQELVEPAVEAIIRARENAATAGAIEKARVMLDDAVMTYAKSRGEWTTKTGRLNQGPTTGKPEVAVYGHARTNKSNVTINLIVAPDAEPVSKRKRKGKKAA